MIGVYELLTYKTIETGSIMPYLKLSDFLLNTYRNYANKCRFRLNISKQAFIDKAE